MERNIPVRKVRKFLTPKRNVDVLRVYYCYQVGSTFLNLGLLETTIVMAMASCDRIKVDKVFQEDAAAFKYIGERHAQLSSSTLGNLINILSKHGIDGSDLAYLRWVKEKRDFFVHRYCRIDPWPGDLHDHALRVLCRRLTYLELIFARAGNRIYRILGRAGLMHVQELGEDGYMVSNFDSLLSNQPELQQLAEQVIRRRARRQRTEEEAAGHPPQTLAKSPPLRAKRRR